MRYFGACLSAGLVAFTFAACGSDGTTSAGPDASASPDAGPGSDGGPAIDTKDSTASPDAPLAAGGEWLTVSGNRILLGGKPFHGRGANLHDMGSCDACTALPMDVPGLQRWGDELVDDWHATFLRFLLEGYASAGGFRQQWKGVVDDTYLAGIKTVVDHIAAKPGVYIMVTLFLDPTIKDNNSDPDSEWPTDAALPLYERIAETFVDQPRVLFGLTNEPHGPADQNDALAAHYQKTIDAIRAIEAKHGAQKHVVVVQAPQNYARDLTYFVQKPLPGPNIAYEIHPYNPQAEFDGIVTVPSKTLPMLIGEYGPAAGTMNEDDIRALWVLAQANEIPHIAWNFHMRCPPNMLQDTAADKCGLSSTTGYAFPRTPWGDMMHDYLATKW